jgi:hypothetical protein
VFAMETIGPVPVNTSLLVESRNEVPRWAPMIAHGMRNEQLRSLAVQLNQILNSALRCNQEGHWPFESIKRQRQNPGMRCGAGPICTA